MQDLSSEIKLLDEFFFVMQDEFPRKYKAWQTLKSAVSVQTANNKPNTPCKKCSGDRKSNEGHAWSGKTVDCPECSKSK